MDIAQCKAALSYRNEHPNAFHEIRLYKDFGDAIITGMCRYGEWCGDQGH